MGTHAAAWFPNPRNQFWVGTVIYMLDVLENKDKVDAVEDKVDGPSDWSASK